MVSGMRVETRGFPDMKLRVSLALVQKQGAEASRRHEHQRLQPVSRRRAKLLAVVPGSGRDGGTRSKPELSSQITSQDMCLLDFSFPCIHSVLCTIVYQGLHFFDRFNQFLFTCIGNYIPGCIIPRGGKNASSGRVSIINRYRGLWFISTL